MTTLSADRIAQITIETLERTAFVLADCVDADASGDLPDPTHFAAIGYEGPQSGSVHLAASEGFLRELASSILGMDPESIDPSQEGCDALAELANIVGGSIVHDLGGADQSYKLGLPAKRDSDSSTQDQQDSVITHLDSEGELLRVTWQSAPFPLTQAA
jgi:CheY-specific phosphatase CheX